MNHHYLHDYVDSVFEEEKTNRRCKGCQTSPDWSKSWVRFPGQCKFLYQILLSQLALNLCQSSLCRSLGSRPAHHPEEVEEEKNTQVENALSHILHRTIMDTLKYDLIKKGSDVFRRCSQKRCLQRFPYPSTFKPVYTSILAL